MNLLPSSQNMIDKIRERLFLKTEKPHTMDKDILSPAYSKGFDKKETPLIEKTEIFDEYNAEIKTPQTIGVLASVIMWTMAVLLGLLLLYFLIKYIKAHIFFISSVVMEVNTSGSTISGQEFPLSVKLRNISGSSFKSGKVIVKVIPDTGEVEYFAKTTVEKDIGEFISNEVKNETVTIVLYGERGDKGNLEVVYEFEDKNSYVTRRQVTNVPYIINEVPFTIGYNIDENLVPGQKMKLEWSIKPNTNMEYSNVLVYVDTPNGYEADSWKMILNKEEIPLFGRNSFLLDKIRPSDSITLSQLGNLNGANNEKKGFHLLLGYQDSKILTDFNGVIYHKRINAMLTSPLLAVKLAINGNNQSSEIIARAGDAISGELVLVNQGNTLYDVRAIVSIQGNMANPERVQSGRGFYDSEKTHIRFDKDTSEDLKEIETNEERTFEFSLSTYDEEFIKTVNLTDPSVLFFVDITAKDKNGKEIIMNRISPKRVAFLSQVEANSLTWHLKGNLKNTGPYPPLAETETSYTLVWEIGGATNTYKNAVMKTKLPQTSNMITEPLPNDITWNDTRRELVWSIGEIKPGDEKKTVMIQVSNRPSLGQVGQSINLTGDVYFEATDVYSNKNIRKTMKEHTSELEGDDVVPIKNGTVRSLGSN